jgi:hypothetical protein
MNFVVGLLALLVPLSTWAQAPAPKEGTWIVKDFPFQSGEVLPELKLHYTTLGSPGAEPVLVLHGTGGSSAGMLAPGYWGPLFAPGEPLDASRYYVILPDAIGAGKSSKPSDGMRAKFPKYNYDDMVRAQYRLVTEHLGVKKLRLGVESRATRRRVLRLAPRAGCAGKPRTAGAQLTLKPSHRCGGWPWANSSGWRSVRSTSGSPPGADGRAIGSGNC